MQSRTIRISVAAVLAMILALTAMYIPAVGSGAPQAGGAAVVYADTTGAAVTTPADISQAQVDPIADQSYTGKAIKPAVTVTLSGAALTQDVDYTVKYSKNKVPGTANVTITGKAPAYTGTLKTTFNVVKASLKDAKIAAIAAQVYTGNDKHPSPKLTVNGRKLKKNTDYTITYKNNTNPGKATVTFKAKKGSYYTGSIKALFKITVVKPVKFKLKVTTDDIVASWALPSGKSTVTGYQVKHASNKALTKDKAVAKVTSQSTKSFGIDRPFYARSYYAKVRSYVTIKGKNYYSPWTTIKSKKAKNLSWFNKVASSIGTDTKWIETDLSKQIVYLHVGKKQILKRYACSTGRPGANTATKKGVYHVTRKIALHDMVGEDENGDGEPDYITKNVPWSTYIYENVAFHGAYWNPQVNVPVDQPRTPRSHGCINMQIKQAKYLYNWAPVGTLVIVHQ
jgi:lipoprotein-anchoring transpeptidase ErfK/SrfK